MKNDLLKPLEKLSQQELVSLLTARPGVVHDINCLSAGAKLTSVTVLDEAREGSLVWVSGSNSRAAEIVATSPATFVICGANAATAQQGVFENKLVIVAENPRLYFMSLLDSLVKMSAKESGIHASAIIDPSAKIGKNTSIGAGCIIASCVIGDHVVIHPGVIIYDDCTIGDHVIINSGTVIGADGFGYERNTEGQLVKFPHIGGVIIHNDVEIGANTCIDRGTIGNTVIGRGSKIDNLVHIAHNVVVGENVAIIANAMIGGSTRIEDNAWISPSATLRDGLKIGESAMIGMGAVVTKSVPGHEVWAGVPAKAIQKK